MGDFCDKTCLYRFDDFELDPSNRTLLNGEIPVEITGKIFDLLLTFVCHPGQLLSKERLIVLVWGGDFIEEGNVAKAVSGLRKVLGDARKEHQFVATVHGHGYRFMRPVQRLAPEAAIEAYVEPAVSRPAEHGWRPVTGLSATVLLAAVFGIALIVYIAPWQLISSTNARFDNVRQTKLTSSGAVYSPVISRSGKYFAFIVATEPDNPSIGLQRIGDGLLRQFSVGPRGATLWGVAISPDDQYIYYILKERTAVDGKLLRLRTTEGSEAPQNIADRVSGFAISADGTRIAFLRKETENASTTVQIIDSEGSKERTVLTTDLETTFFSIDWAPDGKKLIYSVRRHTNGREARYVAQLSVDDGVEELIELSLAGAVSTIRWLPDQTALIAASIDEETGQPQLYHVPYPAGTPTKLTSDVDGTRSFSITADGRSIVVGRADDKRDIWVMNGQNGSVVSRDTDKHFDTVEWMGTDRLVYDEDHQGTYKNRNIWTMRSDGSDRYALTTGVGNNTSATVSPDARTIVFVSNRTGKSQLWQMNADGSEQKQITSIDANISRPSFGRMGSNIYFGAWSQAMNEVWRFDRTDGSVVPVVSGLDVIVWAVSPDEKRISYSYFDDNFKKVLTVDRALDGSDSKSLGDVESETWMRWTSDASSILFNSRKDEAKGIWNLRVENLILKKLTGFDRERTFFCTVSTEGSRTACIRQVIRYDAILIRL